MDSGNIIYIIAVIIYFIYTALKRGKNDQLPDQEAGRDTEGPQEQRRPVSFEDLLKEIRSGQQEREKNLEQTGQGKRVHPVKMNEPDPRTIEKENIPGKIDPRSIEKEAPAPKLEEAIFGKYEGMSSEIERPKLQTLDDQVSLSSTLSGLGIREEGVTISRSKSKPKVNRYAELLKNPQTVKDAVILSEILNRKVF